MVGQLLRRIIRWALYLLLFTTTLLAVFAAALQLPSVRQWALGQIKEQITSRTGWQIEVASVDSITPMTLQLSQVRALHPEIPYIIDLETFTLNFSPQKLLIGELSFPLLKVEGLEIVEWNTPGLAKKVETTFATDSLWNSENLAWLNLHIGRVMLDDLRLPTRWLPDHLTPSLDAQGAVNLRGQLAISGRNQTGTVELSVSTQRSSDDYSHLSVATFSDENDIVLVVRASEDHEGLYHRLLNLPFTNASLELITEQRVPARQLFLSLSEGSSLVDLPWSGSLDLLFNQHEWETDELADQWQKALGSLITMSADTTVKDGQIRLDNIEAQCGSPAAPLCLSGDLTYHLASKQAGFHFAIEGLPQLWHLDSLTSRGPISLMGSFNGAEKVYNLDVELLAQGIQYGDACCGDMKVHAALQQEDNVFQGTIESTYQLGPVAHSSSGQIYWDGGNELRLTELRWHTPSATLKGNVVVDLSSALAVGSLDGQAQDLSWLQLYGFEDVSGSGNLHVELHSKDQHHQGLKLQAKLLNASFQGVKGATLSITGDVHDLFGPLNAKAKVSAHDVRIEGIKVRDLSLDFSMPSWHELWSYKLQASGKWDQKFRVLAEGQVDPSWEAPALILDQLQGKVESQPVQLKEPIMIGWSDEGLTLSSVDFRLGSGEVSLVVEENEQEEAASYKLRARGIPLDFMHYYWNEMPSDGIFSVDARLFEGESGPEAEGVITLETLQWSDSTSITSPSLHGQLKARLQEGVLQAEGHLEGIGDNPVAISLKLPVDIQLSPFYVTLREKDSLSVKVYADGDVAPLLHLILPDSTSVTGLAQIELNIGGTLSKPVVEGSLDLRNCTYEEIDTGCIFRNIQATFEGASNAVLLKQLTADDGQGGQLTATGKIDLDRSKNLPLDLTIELNNTLLLRRDMMQSTASGKLTMSGNMRRVDLSGNLTIDELNIVIPKELPTPASTLDITFVNPPNGRKSKHANQLDSSREPIVHLNVGIEIPRRAFIQSNDLKSEWQGQVLIGGTSSDPSVHGELQVINGSFKLNGRSFRLTRGSISFQGDIDRKCQLYIVGADEIDRYTIEAVLKGPLRDPKLHLQSNPYLSQREILSYLIFNQPLGDVSPLEADEIGRAAVDLDAASGDDSTSVMSRLRRLGIDRIDLNTQDNPDHQDLCLNIGKQLSRDVYISVNRGLTTESNRFCVEANVVRHVKLRAEVDDDATGRLRLMWKHDY